MTYLCWWLHYRTMTVVYKISHIALVKSFVTQTKLNTHLPSIVFFLFVHRQSFVNSIADLAVVPGVDTKTSSKCTVSASKLGYSNIVSVKKERGPFWHGHHSNTMAHLPRLKSVGHAYRAGRQHIHEKSGSFRLSEG